MAKGLKIDFTVDAAHDQTDFPRSIYTGTTENSITGVCVCSSGMTIDNLFTGHTCELSGIDDAVTSVYVKITCEGCDDQVFLLNYTEPSPSPTVTQTPTITPTSETTQTPTPTISPTITQTPTITPTSETTQTPTPTETPTQTMTPTVTITPTVTSECLDCRNWEYLGETIPSEGDVIHYYRCSDGAPQTIVLSNGDPTGNFCNCNGLGNPYSDNGTTLTEIGICGEPPTPTPTVTPTLTPSPVNNVNWYFSRGAGTSCTGSHFEIFKNGNPVPVVSYTNSTGSTSGSISVVAGDVLVISVDTGNQSSPTGCSNAYVKYDSQQFLDDSPGGFTNAEITVTVTQNDINYGIIICGTLGGGFCPS